MWTLFFLLLASDAFARKTGGGGSYGRTSHGTSHSYPHSTGYSGTGTGGSHTYPQSTGYSGSNHVPKQTATHYNVNQNKHTEVHHHYHNHHYSPPQQIGYGSHTYPVYQAAPPVYVYQYRDSGSRFDTLLTGLALYNLGRMSASHNHYDANREYRGIPGEVCFFGIRKTNGDYEETRVDCKLMASFIWESTPQTQVVDQQSERKTVTTTVVKETHTNNETVTVTNTTVVDALSAKGESIKVTPGMSCYLIRRSRDSSAMKKTVECGLLQSYAHNSWRSGAERLSPILTLCIFQGILFKAIYFNG